MNSCRDADPAEDERSSEPDERHGAGATEFGGSLRRHVDHAGRARRRRPVPARSRRQHPRGDASDRGRDRFRSGPLSRDQRSGPRPPRRRGRVAECTPRDRGARRWIAPSVQGPSGNGGHHLAVGRGRGHPGLRPARDRRAGGERPRHRRGAPRRRGAAHVRARGQEPPRGPRAGGAVPPDPARCLIRRRGGGRGRSVRPLGEPVDRTHGRVVAVGSRPDGPADPRPPRRCQHRVRWDRLVVGERARTGRGQHTGDHPHPPQGRHLALDVGHRPRPTPCPVGGRVGLRVPGRQRAHRGPSGHRGVGATVPGPGPARIRCGLHVRSRPRRDDDDGFVRARCSASIRSRRSASTHSRRSFPRTCTSRSTAIESHPRSDRDRPSGSGSACSTPATRSAGSMVGSPTCWTAPRWASGSATSGTSPSRSRPNRRWRRRNAGSRPWSATATTSSSSPTSSV